MTQRIQKATWLKCWTVQCRGSCCQRLLKLVPLSHLATELNSTKLHNKKHFIVIQLISSSLPSHSNLRSLSCSHAGLLVSIISCNFPCSKVTDIFYGHSKQGKYQHIGTSLNWSKDMCYIDRKAASWFYFFLKLFNTVTVNVFLHHYNKWENIILPVAVFFNAFTLLFTICICFSICIHV